MYNLWPLRVHARVQCCLGRNRLITVCSPWRNLYVCVCVCVCVCARARVHERACVVWVLVWVCIWVCIVEE